MEGFSKKCKIEYSGDTLGRYVIAKSDLKSGETILQEGPTLIMPSDGQRRCANCFKLTQSFCSSCHVFPLCGSCNLHNEFECKTIGQMKNLCIDQIQSAEVYGPLKSLLLRENAETTSFYEIMMQLESHQEQRRNSKIWMENKKKIIEPIMKSGLIENLRSNKEQQVVDYEEVLQKFCAICDVNSFEIRAPDTDSLRAIYLNGSLLNHNCVPNAAMTIDHRYQMKVYANRDIRAGEMLWISYTTPLAGTDERRGFLKVGKYFHCTCDRCEDPTELGSYMSSLLCSSCQAVDKEGFIIKIKDHWECQNCAHSMESIEVERILDQAKDEIYMAKDDLRKLEFLIAKLSRILHRNHYLIIDLKQNVAAILRSIIMNITHRPGRLVYERKIRLCEEILEVLRIVQPGISRLKAIALYELCNAHAELSRLRFGENEVNDAELIELLQQVETMLRESLGMLIYEPVNTPEGELTRSMMKELKDLQNDIKLVKTHVNEKFLK